MNVKPGTTLLPLDEVAAAVPCEPERHVGDMCEAAAADVENAQAEVVGFQSDAFRCPFDIAVCATEYCESRPTSCVAMFSGQC